MTLQFSLSYFTVDCTVSIDDAVKKLLGALGVTKELADLNEKELVAVVAGAAHKYVSGNQLHCI